MGQDEGDGVDGKLVDGKVARGLCGVGVDEVGEFALCFFLEGLERMNIFLLKLT